MTFLEQAIFFDLNNWIQGEYSFVEYANDRYEVYVANDSETYILEYHHVDKRKAFSMFLTFECRGLYSKIAIDEKETVIPIVRHEMIFTDEQRIGLSILDGDEIAIDLARDIIARGK